MLQSILGDAVSPRSHFLPKSPIITIGEDIPKTERDAISFLYTIHHEYMHYEEFISWPLTNIGYALSAMRIQDEFARYFGVAIEGGGEVGLTRTPQLVIPWVSEHWDNSLVAAMQSRRFQIGLSALLEASALLDCFVKRPGGNEALVGFSFAILEYLFRERDLVNNREHIIGVEGCLAAIGLGNQHFKIAEDKRHNHSLAAMLPSILMIRTLGQTIVEFGGSSQWQYTQVANFVQGRFPEILGGYFQNVRKYCRAIFSERDVSIYSDLLSPDLRDLSIVANHILFSAFYQMLRTRLPRNAQAFPFFAIQLPLLSILKTYEAMNILTLKRRNIPYLRPSFSLVPTFVFQRNLLTGMWLDFPTGPTGDFRIRFGGDDIKPEQALSWHQWLVFAVLFSIAESLSTNATEIECPFYAWVQRGYMEIGEKRMAAVFEHLSIMCNQCLRVGARSEALAGRIEPSPNYCICATASIPENVRCLFRSVVSEVFCSGDIKR
jgi:hypothetical protein